MQSNVVQSIPHGPQINSHRTPEAAPGIDAASILNRLVPELVALTLNAKQAHWNVVGPAFLPIHQITDELASSTAAWSDEVAERVMALGFTTDARPSTVASTSIEIRSGRISDREVISALIGMIDHVAETARDALADLERHDPVGHDLTIEILHGLDKYRWMFRAQLASRDTPFRVDLPGWSPASLPTPAES